MNASRARRPKSGAKKTRTPGPAGKPKVEATEEEAPVLLSSSLPGGGPGEWIGGEPLRETVLLHAPGTLQDYIRYFCNSLGSTLLEEGPNIKLEYRGSFVKAKLRAAMLDLRFTARFLACLAREAADEKADRLPRSEVELGYFADPLALEVEKIANDIEARIEKGRGKRS